MTNIALESANYGFEQDRTGNIVSSNLLDLPFSRKNCLLNGGTDFHATATAFNAALSALNSNYYYLYSKCFILESNFPTATAGYIGNFQNEPLTKLDIEGIDATNLSDLQAAGPTLTFTFNRFIDEYDVSIDVSAITNELELAYTYVDTITSLNNGNLFAGSTPILISGSYYVSLTSIPYSVSLNNSYTTDPSDVFLTTSTIVSNNGQSTLGINDDYSKAIKFSFADSLSGGLDNLVDIAVGYNEYTGSRILFGISENRLFIFSSNSNSITLLYSSNTVGYERDINFTDLTSIVLYNNTLFIGDKHYNNIYKLNISGFLTNDPVNSNRVIVEKVIGGTGVGIDPTQFNYPEPQFVSNNLLYVFDRNNKYIKIFDLNLNFQRGVSIKELLADTPAISTSRPFHVAKVDNIDQIYLLSTTLVKAGNGGYVRFNDIVIIDPINYFYLFKIRLSSFDSTEVIRDFKQIDPKNSIVYILTNYGLYKFFLSNMSQIGKFTIPMTNYMKVGGISSTDRIDEYVYLYASPGHGIFAQFTETNNYTSLLDDEFFDVYPLSDILVKADENQTFIVYNKTFTKLLHNITTLLKNISVRPQYKLLVGSTLNSRVYIGLNYLTNKIYEQLLPEITKDYFIGENEIFCSDTINRVLGKLYDLILLGLQSIQNDIVFEYTPISLVATTVDNAIMQEVYQPGDFTTYDTTILTETGEVLIYESGQSPSPVMVITTPSINTTSTPPFIDQNTTIIVNPSLAQEVGDLPTRRYVFKVFPGGYYGFGSVSPP